MRAFARKYFESIPAQPAPPAVDITQPPQQGERRLTLADPLARLPRLDVSYRIPSDLSPDGDAVDVLSLVLANGRELALLREHRPAEAARGERRRVRARQPRPAPAADHRDADARASRSTISRRRSTRRSSGSRAARSPSWEIDKARNIARRQMVGESRQLAVARRSSWRRTR